MQKNIDDINAVISKVLFIKNENSSISFLPNELKEMICMRAIVSLMLTPEVMQEIASVLKFFRG
jgi:hypothetical protein